MHFTVLVVGNSDLDEMMAPYDENLEVPEYKVCEVSEEDKQRCLDFYKSKGLEYDSFDECYEVHGDGWNFNRYRKNCYGVWCEYSKFNPQAKYDYYRIGGRYSGRLELNEGRQPVRALSFGYEWSNQDIEELKKLGKNLCDSARKGDVANIDKLTAFAILIDNEWIEVDGPVSDYLKDVTDDTILTYVDCHV